MIGAAQCVNRNGTRRHSRSPGARRVTNPPPLRGIVPTLSATVPNPRVLPMCRMAGCFLTVVTLAVRGSTASGQNPLRDYTEGVEIRFARTQPIVGYTLRVVAGDISGFDVELRLRNVPDTFRLAMVAHPEYDDRYWRYVEALRVATSNGAATVTREDSALWRVVAPGGEALVRYRIHLPPAESPRDAWRPFLTATGGLVGGPHSFMYVVGATLAPSQSPTRAAARAGDCDGTRADARSAHVFRAERRRPGGLAPAGGAAPRLALRSGRRTAPRRVLAAPRRGAVRYDGARGQYRAARPPGGRAVRARAVSRLFVSPAGWCLRRARTPQLGHARRAERGPRSRSRGAARRGRARVLPHLEPDAHPSGGIRRRELPNAAAGARVMVERGAHDALRRSATPARRTARVRLHPRRASGGAHRALPREPGELPLLSRERERDRLRRGTRRPR